MSKGETQNNVWAVYFTYSILFTRCSSLRLEHVCRRRRVRKMREQVI